MCPTEIISFSDKANEFHDINCEVVGVSVDSHFTHLAWINTPRKVTCLKEHWAKCWLSKCRLTMKPVWLAQSTMDNLFMARFMMVLTDFSVLQSLHQLTWIVVDVKTCYFNRREVLATSTSPCCLTLTSRFPGTTGCCWRGQASRLGRSIHTATISNRTICVSIFFFSPLQRLPSWNFIFFSPQLKFVPSVQIW